MMTDQKLQIYPGGGTTIADSRPNNNNSHLTAFFQINPGRPVPEG